MVTSVEENPKAYSGCHGICFISWSVYNSRDRIHKLHMNPFLYKVFILLLLTNIYLQLCVAFLLYTQIKLTVCTMYNIMPEYNVYVLCTCLLQAYKIYVLITKLLIKIKISWFITKLFNRVFLFRNFLLLHKLSLKIRLY